MDSSFGFEGSQYLMGFLHCLFIALLSLATWFCFNALNPVFLAFIYGVIITNVVRAPRSLTPGINFCAHQLMEGVVAILGFVVTFRRFDLTVFGVLNSALIIFLTLFLSHRLGKEIGLSENLATLIGVGTSICGTSAIAVTSIKMDASEEETRVAIGCTTILGLILTIVYALLFLYTPLSLWLNGDPDAYALWVGTSTHEIQNVIAIASILGSNAFGFAILIKIFRILMLGPASYFIVHFLGWKKGAESKGQTVASYLPLYSLLFLTSALAHAFIDVYATELGRFGALWGGFEDSLQKAVLPLLLSVALAGAGSSVKISDLRKMGRKTLSFSALLALIGGSISLALTYAVSNVLNVFI